MEQYFSGCLLGQALGDALGFAVEGGSPETCRRYVDTHLRIPRPAPRGRPPFEFGQYTDDTQLARELALSCAETGRVDLDDFGARFGRIFAEDRIVGWGQTTRLAALRLARGVPWEEAGTSGDRAAGNGGAMRAAPIGLVHLRSDPAHLIGAAADQARVTHDNHLAMAGAVAIAGAVRLAAGRTPVVVSSLVETLAYWCGEVSEPFADELLRLIDWCELEPSAAAQEIRLAGLTFGDEPSWHGISPFVVPSVLWALYSFLRSPHDYWQTICTAIEVGGDVDTTAAMAGAISGAHLGIEALPARLSGKVEDRQTWTYSDLVKLGVALASQTEHG